MRTFTPFFVLMTFFASCLRAQQSGVDSGFVALGSARLYYEAVGSGTPLILVHGGFGDLHYWDEQVDALARHHRVVRYDSRSFGRSSVPVEGERYSDRDELAAVLDHLAIGRAHIAGFSRGSREAIAFALAYPERTRSLVLVGPVIAGYSSPAVTAFNEQARGCRRLRSSQGSHGVVSCLLDSAFRGSVGGPETIERVREIMTFDHPFSTSDQPVARGSGSDADRTNEIAVPTLVVTADHDLAFCKEAAEYLERTVTRVEKIVLPDAGHFMMLETPERFNEVLLRFLAMN